MHSPHRRGRLDTHGQVETAAHQLGQQIARRGHPQMDTQVGVLVAEAAQQFAVVLHGGGVDHSQAQVPGVARAGAVGPVGEVGGESHHLAGVVEHRLGVGPEHTAPAVAVEEGQTHPSLQFGQPLREGRGTHPHPLGSQREGVRVGHSHQILELADGQIGQRHSHTSMIVQFLLTIETNTQSALILSNYD